MNKTITVNIGGFSFVINEIAYGLLQEYLAKVDAKLAGDSSEIMQDIETRIAELLKERLLDTKEVVDESDIEHVQSIMGQPEDFEDENPQEDTFEFDQETSTEPEKSLFRDTDNAMLGGVCSGLAKYFNLDPLVMRIIFVFFAIFAGSGLLLYIILLIVIPPAKTTAQKLKMSGEAVNLESIKSHFNKVGSDLNEKIKSKQFSKKVNSATNKTVEVVSTVAQVFGKIIGVIFTIAGIVSLIFLILYFTGSKDIVPFTDVIKADSFYDFLMVIFPSQIFVNMALISFVFVIGIPLIWIVFTGVKLIFGLKSRVATSIKIIAGIVFGVAFSFLMIAMVRTGMEFSTEGKSTTYLEANDIEQLNISVESDNNAFFQTNPAYGCCDFMVIKDDIIALKNISLVVEQASDTGRFIIKTIAESQGITGGSAAGLANEINYKVELEGDVLKVPSFSTINRSSKFRAQRVKIILKVPKGKSIKFSNGMGAINCFVNGDRHHRDYPYTNQFLNNAVWESNGEELECLQCWD